MITWSVLEHRVYRLLRQRHWQGKSLLVLVSGGADSVCLLSVLRNLQKALKYELSVIHFHHGIHENKVFRDRSEKFVRKLCAQWDLSLKVIQNFDPSLSSEAELRQFRAQALREFQEQGVYLVSGHHRDDLLETRILRLIRGTGARGLVAMRVQKAFRLRPLLTSSRVEIEADLKAKKIRFLRDPSQHDLRSWLRLKWLPLLEKRQKSALETLARSLEVLAGSLEKQTEIPEFLGDVLPRNLFFQQSVERQSSVLARYMSRCGTQVLSHSLVQECLKQLDKNQIEHIFILAGLLWRIDAKNIRAEALRR